jgi:hypothetical protein
MKYLKNLQVKGFYALIGIMTMSPWLCAQSNVIKIELKGDIYTVCKQCKDFPQEIIGEYLYQSKGEPKVELKEGGTGWFQRHDVPADAINYWIDCDENGVIRKRVGQGGAFEITILYQYINDGIYGIKAGDYSLMGLVVSPASGQVIILGERYKSITK